MIVPLPKRIHLIFGVASLVILSVIGRRWLPTPRRSHAAAAAHRVSICSTKKKELRSILDYGKST
jgi:hypothetical protein